MGEVLIIFTKNPVHGKVKTRLAATIGNDKALEIYKVLVQHTYVITKELSCDKIVFYFDEPGINNIWENNFQKQIQHGNDLGERMMNAFDYVFKNQYTKALIIGTDCPELSQHILNDAFDTLNEYDVIIGPATDGGYYLLGMKKLYPKLFKDIQWSTANVLNETIKRCNECDLHYLLLPAMNDVDEEKDLKYMKKIK